MQAAALELLHGGLDGGEVSLVHLVGLGLADQAAEVRLVVLDALLFLLIDLLPERPRS